MIIECTNCHKKFDIDKDLIPNKGRLLQCSSCNHEWFFKSEEITKLIVPVKNENLEIFESKDAEYDEPINIDEDININDKINIPLEEKIAIKDFKIKKKYNILSLIIVFVISFVAIIILIDTFDT